MIKMNFNNDLNDEDRRLIRLLKEQTLESPSDDLVERTISRLAARQAEEKLIHKPLKAPLYLMIVICLLLFMPVLMPLSYIRDMSPISQLLAYAIAPIIRYAVWCWLVVIALWIVFITFRIHSIFHLKQSKS